MQLQLHASCADAATRAAAVAAGCRCSASAAGSLASSAVALVEFTRRQIIVYSEGYATYQASLRPE